MFKGLRKDYVPVLIIIHNLDENGFYYFNLDNSEYSLIPNEQEVLFPAGSIFKIVEIA